MLFSACKSDFILSIPDENIRENGDCRLKSIAPFPFFIGGHEKDGSSLVIPYEGGGICRSRDKTENEYRLAAYMLSMPSLSGIDFGSGIALSAIVEGGRYDCSLALKTCWGEKKRYSLDTVFVLRDHADEKILAEEITIYYRILKDGDANYAGIARNYRQFNLEQRQLPTLAHKIKNNPALEYSCRALSLRCRMGVKPVPPEILEQTPDTQPPMKEIFMTFADVRKLVEECAGQNVGPTEFCMVGWNYGGHDGAFPQLFPVASEFGGENELRRTINRSTELGYPMSLFDNYYDSYSLANNFDETLIARNYDGSKRLSAKLSGGQAYGLCARCAYENYAVKSIPEVAGLGADGVYYIDEISLMHLEKCYHPEHPMSRRENAYWWKKIFRLAQEQFGGCYSEGAKDWAMPELDRAYQVMPLPELEQPFIDETVPLFQIVYHGFLIYNSYRNCVNTFPGENGYLKNLASGGMPIIYYHHLFHPGWSASIGWAKNLIFGDAAKLADDVARFKRITDDIAATAGLQTEFMDNFIRHSPTLTETVYSNGSRVFVNYADKPCKLEHGETVPAMDFMVIAGI
jgi:hypothetical protein